MLKRTLCWIGLLLTGAAAAQAETATPLDAPLANDGVTLIATPYTDEALPLRGWPADQLFHYRLYLPGDYAATAPRRYPALFIASPLSNADMGTLVERLLRDRWVVVMLVESRNASNVWLPNFIAAYDDAVARLRIDPDMLFCTGVSGAAKVCSVYPGIRPGFRGMILQAAGLWRGDVFDEPDNHDLVVYGTFGTMDFNRRFAAQIRRAPPPGVRRSVTVWDGGHGWAPAPVLEHALDWVEAKVLLESPTDPDHADVYVWHVENRLAAYEAATDVAARDRQGEYLLLLRARWRALLPDDLAARLDAVAESYRQAGADPAIAAERAAREALRVARSREEVDGSPFLEPSIALYEWVARRHPDTAAGATAAARAQSLGWETGRRPPGADQRGLR
jgi:hypothetical protein